MHYFMHALQLFYLFIYCFFGLLKDNSFMYWQFKIYFYVNFQNYDTLYIIYSCTSPCIFHILNLTVLQKYWVVIDFYMGFCILYHFFLWLTFQILGSVGWFTSSHFIRYLSSLFIARIIYLHCTSIIILKIQRKRKDVKGKK